MRKSSISPGSELYNFLTYRDFLSARDHIEQMRRRFGGYANTEFRAFITYISESNDTLLNRACYLGDTRLIELIFTTLYQSFIASIQSHEDDANKAALRCYINLANSAGFNATRNIETNISDKIIAAEIKKHIGSLLSCCDKRKFDRIVYYSATYSFQLTRHIYRNSRNSKRKHDLDESGSLSSGPKEEAHLLQQHKRLKRDYEQIKEQLAQKSRECVALQQSKSGLQHSRDELQQQFDQKSKESEKLRRSLASSAQRQKKLSEQQCQLVEKYQSYAASSADAKKQVSALVEQQVSAHQEIELGRKQLSRLTQEHAKYQEKLRSSDAIIVDLKSEAITFKRTNTTLQSEVCLLKKQNEAAKQQLASKDKVFARYQQAEEKSDELVSDVLAMKLKLQQPTAPSVPAVIDLCVCPITLEVMEDPVTLLDTNMTYERTAIEEWMQDNKTCPSTGKKIETKELKPAIKVKELIVRILSDHGVENQQYRAAMQQYKVSMRNYQQATALFSVIRQKVSALAPAVGRGASPQLFQHASASKVAGGAAQLAAVSASSFSA